METKALSANDVLAQMRALRQAATQKSVTLNPVADPSIVTKPNNSQFGNVFTQALDKVNSLQQESASLSKRVAMGDDTVSLAETMIASQKSSVAFRATLEVRNKLVEAYKEIKSMPV
jgi:flagellar hook-basal body complex protein FliE